MVQVEVPHLSGFVNLFFLKHTEELRVISLRKRGAYKMYEKMGQTSRGFCKSSGMILRDDAY